jgi:CBS domain containing-hemolysin-like protein
MEKIDGELDKPPRRKETDRGGFWGWLKRIFSSKRKDLSPEEREKAIEESIEQFATQVSSEENILEEDERGMIHGVVELGETTAREIMVPRVDMVGISQGAPLADAVETIKQSGHSRIPLYNKSHDEILGIVYAKDLLSYTIKAEEVDLAKIARKAYFIPENLKLDDLLRQMRSKKLHIAVVVDEYGGTSGIVTMEDIIEEIVGEIEDEYDIEPPPIIKKSDGVYLVDGTLTIADLNEELGLSLPEGEFETVGGLIYDIVGSLPTAGQVIEYQNIQFTVDQIDGQRIVKVKITIRAYKEGEKE